LQESDREAVKLVVKGPELADDSGGRQHARRNVLDEYFRFRQIRQHSSGNPRRLSHAIT
jgi:hypothetical protein